MPTAKPAVFATADGREFTSEAAAQKHEEWINAREAYESARRTFGRLTAESLLTADGYPFQLSRMWPYYAIVRGNGWKPMLREVNYYIWNVCFRNLHGEAVGEELAITQDVDGKHFDYRVSDLYMRRENAEEALLAQQEEWLADEAAEVAKLRARVVPQEAKG